MIEQTLLPVFIVVNIIIIVTTLCSKNWMEGYYGDVMVTQLSPWYLCDVNCLTCQYRKPLRHCFWMQDWTNTGFDSFSFVQHLEYWTLGSLSMALCLALADRLGTSCHWKCGHNCPIAARRSAILLMVICCLLSTISLSLVGAKLKTDASDVSSFSDLHLHYGWPFPFRCVGAVFTGIATITAISLECRIRAENTGSEYDDRILVVSSSELAEDCLSDDDDDEDGVVL